MRAAVPLEVWPERVSVQIRARHKPQTATWSSKEEGIIEFVFDNPVDAVALGQAAVAYDGDILLGGAMITERVDGDFARKAPARKSIRNVMQNA